MKREALSYQIKFEYPDGKWVDVPVSFVEVLPINEGKQLQISLESKLFNDTCLPPFGKSPASVSLDIGRAFEIYYRIKMWEPKIDWVWTCDGEVGVSCVLTSYHYEFLTMSLHAGHWSS